jgi:hypothetical protein
MRIVTGRDLSPISPVVPAVAGRLESLSFSPDGTTVDSGGGDGSIAFWEGRMLRPIGAPIRSARPGLWEAFYRSDGSVAGYMPAETNDAEQWFTMPARADQWLSSVCQLAGTTLSQAEWDRYLGTDRPYRNVC